MSFKLRFALAISAVCIVGFLFGMTVSIAKADYSQNTNNVVSTNNPKSNTVFRIGMGNGFTGQITDYEIYSDSKAGSVGNWTIMRVSVEAYTDATYTTPVSGSPDCYWNYNNAPSTVQAGYVSIGDGNGASGTGFTSLGETASGCTINPSYFYTITFQTGSNWANSPYFELGGVNTSNPNFNVLTNLTDIGLPYFVIFGMNAPGVPDTSTRITDPYPIPDSVHASTSVITYGAGGYINPDDFVENRIQLRVQMMPLTAPQGANLLNYAQNYYLTATSSGNFYLTGTTTLSKEGGYSLLLELSRKSWCFLSICFGNTLLDTSTTYFVIGTTTALDQIALNNLSQLGVLDTASSTVDTSCYFSNLAYCLIGIVVPNASQLTGAGQTLSDALEQNLPFAFFWQSYTKISTITSSTTPEELSANVTMHNTFLQGTTTIFAWSDAKDFMDTTIPEDTVLYLIYAEWILFGIYLIVRVIQTI